MLWTQEEEIEFRWLCVFTTVYFLLQCCERDEERGCTICSYTLFVVESKESWGWNILLLSWNSKYGPFDERMERRKALNVNSFHKQIVNYWRNVFLIVYKNPIIITTTTTAPTCYNTVREVRSGNERKIPRCHFASHFLVNEQLTAPFGLLIDQSLSKISFFPKWVLSKHNESDKILPAIDKKENPELNQKKFQLSLSLSLFGSFTTIPIELLNVELVVYKSAG